VGVLPSRGSRPRIATKKRSLWTRWRDLKELFAFACHRRSDPAPLQSIREGRGLYGRRLSERRPGCAELPPHLLLGIRSIGWPGSWCPLELTSPVLAEGYITPSTRSLIARTRRAPGEKFEGPSEAILVELAGREYPVGPSVHLLSVTARALRTGWDTSP